MAQNPARFIRFVGNADANAEGKFLWEILAQLRAFGVGRMVTRNEWGRKWPHQPSYLVVKRAAPEMDRWLHCGTLWAEWTFRGRNLGLYEFSHDLNRSDWRLIHRHEEADFKKCEQPMGKVYFPDSFPLPPLQTVIAKRQAVKDGVAWTENMGRAPLQLSIDPELRAVSQFIKQIPPKTKGKSIYDEVDADALLDLYGAELPTKVEAWNMGPAETTERYRIPPTETKRLIDDL